MAFLRVFALFFLALFLGGTRGFVTTAVIVHFSLNQCCAEKQAKSRSKDVISGGERKPLQSTRCFLHLATERKLIMKFYEAEKYQ